MKSGTNPDRMYLSSATAAQRLGVPSAWLRREADAGRVPCLRVGRRLMFNLDAVRETLERRSSADVSMPKQEASS